MHIDLSDAQREAQRGFRTFVDQYVAPFAEEHDRQQAMPQGLIKQVIDAGYLAGIIPVEYGGTGMDTVTWGLLC